MTLSKKMINAQVMEQRCRTYLVARFVRLKWKWWSKSRLVCLANHSFDLSKNGYVNLAPQAHVTKYDKSLFEARKTVMNSGFFDPVLEAVIHNDSSAYWKGRTGFISGCRLWGRLPFVDDSSQLTGEVKWSRH